MSSVLEHNRGLLATLVYALGLWSHNVTHNAEPLSAVILLFLDIASVSGYLEWSLCYTLVICHPLSFYEGHYMVFCYDSLINSLESIFYLIEVALE